MFRLIVPVSFESSFSLLPGKTNMISPGLVNFENSSVNAGIIIEDHSLHSSIQPNMLTVDDIAGASPMQGLLEAGTFVWLIGIFSFIAYAVVSYVRLSRKLTFATQLRGNVFETDQIQTPIVLGFVKPRIYLPLGIAPEDEAYILKHERVHIKRFDHLIKPLSFLVMVLHWFNPLMWIAYFLMIKDMEMSCDEKVILESNRDARTSYSRTLLSLSSKQSGLLGPLSFGESNVKARIKNILNDKRPTFWVGMVVIVVVLVAVLSLLANPVTDQDEMGDEQDIIALVEHFGSKLRTVSLTNPPSQIVSSIQENYSDFVSPELMAFWVGNLEHAPGRLTSSPWPERIDIESMDQSAPDAYEVTGRIVEVTEGGDVAATRLIELEIKKVDGHWMINNSMLGPYKTVEEPLSILRDGEEVLKYRARPNKESLAGYIHLEDDTLYLDRVEVITTEEGDRITGLDLHDPDQIAELGLQETDMPNGYYIHDLNAETIAFELIDGTLYTFTDVNLLFVEDAESDRRYSTTDKEQFVEHINMSLTSGQVTYPFFIEVSDGKVRSITEVFLFTQ